MRTCDLEHLKQGVVTRKFQLVNKRRKLQLNTWFGTRKTVASFTQPSPHRHQPRDEAQQEKVEEEVRL